MIFKDPDIEKALDKIHYPLMILKTLPIYIYTHTHTFMADYGWFMLLYSRNQHNVVTQLSSRFMLMYGKTNTIL